MRITAGRSCDPSSVHCGQHTRFLYAPIASRGPMAKPPARPSSGLSGKRICFNGSTCVKNALSAPHVTVHEPMFKRSSSKGMCSSISPCGTCVSGASESPTLTASGHRTPACAIVPLNAMRLAVLIWSAQEHRGHGHGIIPHGADAHCWACAAGAPAAAAGRDTRAPPPSPPSTSPLPLPPPPPLTTTANCWRAAALLAKRLRPSCDP
mmetsp:Transcript_5458/g.16259  ORF Transcript_5458/g.16259 Transcript_5458/m.16259 type:complete len:208 (+) Transcript_5458:337-960(+)